MCVGEFLADTSIDIYGFGMTVVYIMADNNWNFEDVIKYEGLEDYISRKEIENLTELIRFKDDDLNNFLSCCIGTYGDRKRSSAAYLQKKRFLSLGFTFTYKKEKLQDLTNRLKDGDDPNAKDIYKDIIRAIIEDKLTIYLGYIFSRAWDAAFLEFIGIRWNDMNHHYRAHLCKNVFFLKDHSKFSRNIVKEKESSHAIKIFLSHNNNKSFEIEVPDTKYLSLPFNAEGGNIFQLTVIPFKWFLVKKVEPVVSDDGPMKYKVFIEKEVLSGSKVLKINEDLEKHLQAEGFTVTTESSWKQYQGFTSIRYHDFGEINEGRYGKMSIKYKQLIAENVVEFSLMNTLLTSTHTALIPDEAVNLLLHIKNMFRNKVSHTVKIIESTDTPVEDILNSNDVKDWSKDDVTTLAKMVKEFFSQIFCVIYIAFQRSL